MLEFFTVTANNIPGASHARVCVQGLQTIYRVLQMSGFVYRDCEQYTGCFKCQGMCTGTANNIPGATNGTVCSSMYSK